jgi:hypothetical protein
MYNASLLQRSLYIQLQPDHALAAASLIEAYWLQTSTSA